MAKNDEFEFDLESIMREFGSGSDDLLTVEEETPPAQPVEEPVPGETAVPTEEPPAEPVPETPAPIEEAPEAEMPAEPGTAEEEDFSSDFWNAIRNAPLLEEDRKASEPPSAPEEPDKPHLIDPLLENPDYQDRPDLPRRDSRDTLPFPPVTGKESAPDGNTIRVDTDAVNAALEETAQPDTDAAKSTLDGETIRLDADAVNAAAEKKSVSADTVVFTPVSGEEEPEEPAPAAEPAIPEGAEPFSKNWEPHYEEPMGEYVPPEPIVFRPRSRLNELKKKLVAGPERRYYALAEEGLGKYQVSIFLSCLVVILSVAAVCLYEMGMVQEERMRLLVFGELFAMLLSALLGSDRLLEGFVSIFRGRFSLDSLMTMTFVVCVVDCVFCLQEIRVPFCAAFCLEMTASLWAEFERRNTEMGQMDTMRRATRLNRVAKAPDCFEGRPGFYVEDGEVEDFMDTYQAPSAPEKLMNTYALIAFLASGAVGLFAGITGGVTAGFRTWSAAILAAAPATAFLCQSRPMAVLERRMHKLGVVLCGWQGVKSACGSSVVPLTDSDLFPGGSVKVNGVKFYSQRDPDQTVEYGTALIEASGMGIADLFTQLRESRYGRHYEVENFRYYENGGIGGEVCGESVLVGSLSFLQEMGVDLPDGARVSQAVYVAVDGELCGVFAMAFGKLKGVSAGLGTLCGYRGLTPVLATGNFLLSESFIRAKFNANTRRFAFPSVEEREKLSQWQPDEEKKAVCALTTQEGLAPMAFAITGARALRSAVNVGTWMHILGGIVGMVVVLLLTIVEGGALLTPANLLILELIWAVPGLLITEWTRRL